MQNAERLIKLIYKKWKSAHPTAASGCPDEEDLACFLENRLSPDENKNTQAHLVKCDNCAAIVSGQLKGQSLQRRKAPAHLLKWAKKLSESQETPSILEIAIRLKENLLELVKTSGAILNPPGLSPIPILRSGTPKEFQDEVRVFKDFKDIRVEVIIENKQGRAFSLTVLARDKKNQKTIKDLRVSLFRDNRELESYLSDTGKAVFEDAVLGRYEVELSSPGQKLASMVLDIKNL